MSRVDVLVFTSEDFQTDEFVVGELELVFQHLRQPGPLPPLGHTASAFVEWALPGISGLEVCRRLRCDPRTAQAHITMLLDEDDAEARRRALRAGADDYMPGPAHRDKIIDRITSRELQQASIAAREVVSAGDLAIDLAAIQASWRGAPIPLMPNEFRVLRFLAQHPRRVFTRAQLIEAVGKNDPHIDERTVDAWMARVRRGFHAIGADSPVRTVRSLGYVLDAS